jgi:hypothetical protein
MAVLQHRQKNQERTIQGRLDSNEILHFCDMLAPHQNFTLDKNSPSFVYDEDRQQANQNLITFLKSKYGERSVITSSLNYNGEGLLEDVPGLIGVYVTTLAFDVAKRYTRSRSQGQGQGQYLAHRRTFLVY